MFDRPQNREQRRHPEKDLLTVPEAAKRMGVCSETLYRLARAGQFPPALRVGRKILVSVPKLERHLHGDA